MSGERWDKSKVLIDHGKQWRGVRRWQAPPPRSLIFYGIHFVELEMKLNVLINLFVLREYLPERRCTSTHARAHTHEHSFLANYSLVVIEKEAVSKCKGSSERWGLLKCACWLFYSSETFWLRTTNHKTRALSLISAIHHKKYCILTHHTGSNLSARPLIGQHKPSLQTCCSLNKMYFL